ncbi:hypothetical protein QJQ45_026514 [Haematococcus lacustris]|nr:hypothetical protein QJQ45_026514 [Haematococcus lacustris]
MGSWGHGGARLDPVQVAAAAAELAVPHYCTSCIFAAAAPGATAASFQPTLNLLTSIVLVYGTTSALRGYCFSILNNRMTKRLRSQLFAALVRRETGFFDATETGTLTSRLQADCQAMTKCVATNLNIAMRNMMQAIACGVAALQVAEEVLSLSRVVGLRQATGYGLFVGSGHITCYSTKVVALTLGCALVLQGSLTAEQLTNYIFYVEFVTYASLSACDEIVEVLEALGASERVVDLLDQPPAPQVQSGKVLPSWSGRVQLCDLSFAYPTRPDTAALTAINLELQPGKLVALVGLSGSGKTSLVALLQRLYDPTSGSILIDGTDLRELDAGWYRSQLGVVNQEPRLFGTTVRDNIAYGCPGVGHQEVVAAAKEANAHAFIQALPQGYDTLITDRLLSGGQKQRVALARALVRKPRLLVLDEATSALDAESEAQVQAALDAAMAARNRTVVVIAHRLSTVRNADTTVVMDKGRIVEVGTHSELVQQRGIYYHLISRQQGHVEPAAGLSSQGAGELPGQGQQDVLPALHLPGRTPAALPGSTLGDGQAKGGGQGDGWTAAAEAQMGWSSTLLTTDESFLADHLQGTTSSDEGMGGGSEPRWGGDGGPAYNSQGQEGWEGGSHGHHRRHGMSPEPSEPDSQLLVAAAAAVTAENELASKVLGSQGEAIAFALGGSRSMLRARTLGVLVARGGGMPTGKVLTQVL